MEIIENQTFGKVAFKRKKKGKVITARKIKESKTEIEIVKNLRSFNKYPNTAVPNKLRCYF